MKIVVENTLLIINFNNDDVYIRYRYRLSTKKHKFDFMLKRRHIYLNLIDK